MTAAERVSVDALKNTVRRLFEAAGLAESDAVTAAEGFVLQEMRGVTTHGLLRLKPRLEELRDGRLNPRPRRRVVSEAGAMAVLDGDRGLGIPGCYDAMRRAVAMAKEHGAAVVVVRENGHFLGAAPYCLAALEQGAIGIAFSNSGASMAYPGAREAVLGNGPFGYALPTAAGFPLVYDAAMTVSGGKLLQWQQEGLPEGEEFTGLDGQGNPTSDPGAVLEGGATLPIGGHKGAGLVLLIEVLTGLLSGGAFLHAAAGGPGARDRHSQCCIALDIAHFMPPEEFRERTAAYVREIKGHPSRDGREILLPGERAHRAFLDCQANGVPLPGELLTELRECAHEFGMSTDF